jgi:hypothetical protein
VCRNLCGADVRRACFCRRLCCWILIRPSATVGNLSVEHKVSRNGHKVGFACLCGFYLTPRPTVAKQNSDPRCQLVVTHGHSFSQGPASWSSGPEFLIMRFRVRFPVLPWGFFLEGEDRGLGSSVELGFKAPPGPSYSYITIHFIGTT